MIDRRRSALDDLAAVAEPVLLIEWSAPRNFALDDVEGWRMASPAWTSQREQMIRMRSSVPSRAWRQRTRASPTRSSQCAPSGSISGRSPCTRAHHEVALVDPERWHGLEVGGAEPVRVWVAVADNLGRGAGVVAVADVGEGRYEVDGWTCPDRQTALESAQRTIEALAVPGQSLRRAQPHHHRPGRR